jgi:hypothetical protein
LFTNVIFVGKLFHIANGFYQLNLMLRVFQVTFFLLFAVSLYIIFDLYKELELTKRSNIEQDKLVFNLIRASLKQNNLLLNGVIKYKNFENNIDQNDDY